MRERIEKLESNKQIDELEKDEETIESKEIKFEETSIKENTVIIDLPKKKKISPKQIESEIKNTFILISGSVLIVLAAIIFLISTWTRIPNIIKCITIFLMYFLFTGLSNISKNKFKLEQTSKAFKYIALAYLPLSFLGVSILRIIGDYLSINGEGKYIYLTFISFATSIIYHYESKKDNNYILYLVTLFMELFSVFFFTKVVLNFMTDWNTLHMQYSNQ